MLPTKSSSFNCWRQKKPANNRFERETTDQRENHVGLPGERCVESAWRRFPKQVAQVPYPNGAGLKKVSLPHVSAFCALHRRRFRWFSEACTGRMGSLHRSPLEPAPLVPGACAIGPGPASWTCRLREWSGRRAPGRAPEGACTCTGWPK